EHELAAVVLGVEPVEESSAGAADVEVAGWRWCEAKSGCSHWMPVKKRAPQNPGGSLKFLMKEPLVDRQSRYRSLGEVSTKRRANSGVVRQSTLIVANCVIAFRIHC